MSRLLRLCFMLAISAVALWGAPARAADSISVAVDEALLVKMPEKVGTLVIGNPLIADVSVQAGGTMVLTGKGYGATNLIALDRQGNVLLEKEVRVRGPRDKTVVVFRGVQRETYSCLPNCEKRITLGDNNEFFTGILGQVGARNNQAQGAGPQAR